MNPTTLARLRELLAKAAAGTWFAEYENADYSGGGCWYNLRTETLSNPFWFPYNGPKSDGEEAKANADLLTEAVNALPALLGAYEALRDAVEGAPEGFVVGQSGPDQFFPQTAQSCRWTIRRASKASASGWSCCRGRRPVAEITIDVCGDDDGLIAVENAELSFIRVSFDSSTVEMRWEQAEELFRALWPFFEDAPPAAAPRGAEP